MPYHSILLIDDDENDHEIFLTALKEIDSSIACVTMISAREALDKLIAKEIQPDIMFLDLNLPVMNGQQFLVELRKYEELSTIPVIVLSTYAHKATVQLTKEFGARDFYAKPTSFDGVVAMLKAVLR